MSVKEFAEYTGRIYGHKFPNFLDSLLLSERWAIVFNSIPTPYKQKTITSGCDGFLFISPASTSPRPESQESGPGEMLQHAIKTGIGSIRSWTGADSGTDGKYLNSRGLLAD